MERKLTAIGGQLSAVSRQLSVVSSLSLVIGFGKADEK
jgi:hypothetical protein